MRNENRGKQMLSIHQLIDNAEMLTWVSDKGWAVPEKSVMLKVTKPKKNVPRIPWTLSCTIVTVSCFPIVWLPIFHRAASHLDGAASILVGICGNIAMRTGQMITVDDWFALPERSTIIIEESWFMLETRYFSPDPTQQRVGQSLYNEIKTLPLICQHRHVDPRLFASGDFNPYPFQSGWKHI